MFEHLSPPCDTVNLSAPWDAVQVRASRTETNLPARVLHGSIGGPSEGCDWSYFPAVGQAEVGPGGLNAADIQDVVASLCFEVRCKHRAF